MSQEEEKKEVTTTTTGPLVGNLLEFEEPQPETVMIDTT